MFEDLLTNSQLLPNVCAIVLEELGKMPTFFHDGVRHRSAKNYSKFYLDLVEIKFVS